MGLQTEITREKIAWYILDEIAVEHSFSHTNNPHTGEVPPSYKENPKPWGCPICDRAEEAMRLLKKPTHQECRELYERRGK